MRTFLAVLAVMFMATGAWAGLGLPNELVDPGFEAGGAWGGVPFPGMPGDHLSYGALGLPAATAAARPESTPTSAAGG